MSRNMLIFSLLTLSLGCSDRFKENGDQPDPVGDDTGEVVDTGDTDTEDTGDTGDTEPEECPEAPGAGSVSTISGCVYTPEPSGEPFSASIEWSLGQHMADPASGAPIPAYTFAEEPTLTGVFQSPAVGQATDDNGDGYVDADDTPDVAVIMGDEFSEESDDAEQNTSVLRLISGADGSVHDSLAWDSVGGKEYAPYLFAGLAMGDIDADGNTDIATTVYERSSGNCYVGLYSVADSGTLSLEAVNTGDAIYCESHAPALADIDGDGDVDIVLGATVYESDLSIKWEKFDGMGWFNAAHYGRSDAYWNSGFHSFPYDMDGDGLDMEIVAGNTVYNSDGTVFCEMAGDDGYPAVADITGDGSPEIVLTGNNYVSVYSGDPTSGGDCSLIDQVPNKPEDDPAVSGSLPAHPDCDTSRYAFGGQPTVADFNGDGTPEIGVAGSCWYSVYQLKGGHLSRYAMTQTRDWSSASTGSTVFDFNGDGEAEVVFSDEDAVYVWGVDDSAGLDPWERLVTYLRDDNHKSWTIHEYPLVADVDGDGKAEILAVNSPRPDYLGYYGIYVLGAANDDWVSARPHWNQHAYYVTNIEDDGYIGYGEPNISDLNAFRQQAPGSFGTKAAPNLYLETSACQDECGTLTVWLQVANEGKYITANGGLMVSLYGEKDGKLTRLATSPLPADVAPGELTPAMEFDVELGEYQSLVAVVDDPAQTPGSESWGSAKECDESDNEATLDLADYCR